MYRATSKEHIQQVWICKCGHPSSSHNTPDQKCDYLTSEGRCEKCVGYKLDYVAEEF